MMKTQNKKRGFTIIELVIVVTVIAILSAVMIPTFAGIIKKANLSADKQAVANMNKVLKTEEFKNFEDAYGALVDNGINANAPASKGYTYYWDSVNNTVVLLDGTQTPEEGYVDLDSAVSSEKQLKLALAKGLDIYLMSDITLTSLTTLTEADETNIYLNGFDIIRESGDVFYVNNANAVLNIYGSDETVKSNAGTTIWATNGTVNVYGGNFTAASHAAYSQGGTINIYGGKFTSTSPTTNNADTQHTPVNMQDSARGTGIINVYGGEFHNAAGEYDLSAQIALGEVVDHR